MIEVTNTPLGWSKMPANKSNMVGSYYLLKNAIFPQWIDWFWRNLAGWHISDLSTQTSNFTILKIQEAAGCIGWLHTWKSTSIAISQKMDHFQQNLVCWCIVALPTIRAIKDTKYGNKMANLKSNSLSSVNSNRSKTAKIIKRLYHSASRCHLDDVMVITF